MITISELILSPWFKQILNLNALKYARMEEFLIIFEGIFSPRLKKILDFNALKCTRMNEFQIIFMVEKYFLTPK